MANPVFPDVGRNDSIEQLREVVGEVNQLLNWLFQGNIDSLNIRRVTADKINTGTLDAGKVTIRSNLSGGAYIVIDGNGLVVNNGSINTVEIDTNGNAKFRGDIVAGADIDVTSDVYIGDNLYLNETSPTSKGIIFNNQGGGNSARISVLSGDVSLNADGHITMTIGSSQGLVVNQKVTADGFEALSGVVQAQYINAIGTLSAGNGASGTFYVASTLGGPIDTEVTVESGIITSIV